MPYEVVAVESLKNDVLSPFANSEVKNFDGVAKNSLRSGLLRPSAHRYSSLIFENIHWFSAVFSRYSYVRSSPHDKKESAVASSSDSVYSLPVLILELIIVEDVLVSEIYIFADNKNNSILAIVKVRCAKKAERLPIKIKATDLAVSGLILSITANGSHANRKGRLIKPQQEPQ